MMQWILIVLPGMALAIYCLPFALIEHLAWRRHSGQVRVGKAAHWSVEKAYERWRLHATTNDMAGRQVIFGVYPFPADNVCETRDEAEQKLAEINKILEESPTRSLLVHSFFWIKCIKPNVTDGARKTAWIGVGVGMVLAIGGAVAAIASF